MGAAYLYLGKVNGIERPDGPFSGGPGALGYLIFGAGRNERLRRVTPMASFQAPGGMALPVGHLFDAVLTLSSPSMQVVSGIELVGTHEPLQQVGQTWYLVDADYHDRYRDRLPGLLAARSPHAIEA